MGALYKQTNGTLYKAQHAISSQYIRPHKQLMYGDPAYKQLRIYKRLHL
jgi:hypothetical protein